MHICLVNGVEQSNIPVTDRGIAYGDGVFTTAKIVAGQIEYLPEHIKRLSLSCNRLSIDGIDFSSLSILLSAVAEKFELAVLKVTITSGSGGRGYSRPEKLSPTVIISVFDFPTHYNRWQIEGVNLGLSDFKLGHNPSLAGIKHLNRLEQVMIKQELEQLDEFDDLVVTDINNLIIETSAANVFWLRDQVWYTATLTRAGIEGIMATRIKTVLNHANQLIVGDFHVSELENCQSMFICNCLMGIVPVATYKNKALSIEPVSKLAAELN